MTGAWAAAAATRGKPQMLAHRDDFPWGRRSPCVAYHRCEGRAPWLRLCCCVLQQPQLFARRDSFGGAVDSPATSVQHRPWLRLRCFVGQPILAAVGFQPALARCAGSFGARQSHLKGGWAQRAHQDCPMPLSFRCANMLKPSCFGPGTEVAGHGFLAAPGRLKAGCSQDWLPHNLRSVTRRKHDPPSFLQRACATGPKGRPRQ